METGPDHADPNPLDFGNVFTGSVNQSHFDLVVTGPDPVTISSITFVGPNVDQFAVDRRPAVHLRMLGGEFPLWLPEMTPGLRERAPDEYRAIMVVTLWISRKARTVTDTEISLAHQSEREERFESVFLSRAIVRVVLGTFEAVRRFVPGPVREWATERLQPVEVAEAEDPARPSFDLLRASVNLMVASAIISYLGRWSRA